MGALISPSGLFGDEVNSVVERFQESAKQAATLQKLLPRLTHISGAAEREQTLTSKAAPHTVPHRDRAWLIVLSHLKNGDTGNTGCALPVQVESSLYKKCGVLLGAGLWRLADRYL